MNRRNFILGLGTAATLSGAASVTSAALQGSVEPGADFRVISAEQLDVRRNSALVTAGDEVDDTQSGFVNSTTDGGDWVEGTTEGDLNFSTAGDTIVYETEGPNMTIDSGENGELNMSLATPNTNDTVENRNLSYGGDSYYAEGTYAEGSYNGTALLEVENLGSSDAEVSIDYTYGESTTEGSGNIDPNTVADLFTFRVAEDDPDGDGVTQTDLTLSPPDSTSDNGDFATVGAGNTLLIDFVINYSDEIEQALRQELDSGFGSSGDDLDLLDTVAFGVEDSA